MVLSIMKGSEIKGYCLEKKLGQGACGEVWRARNRRTSKVVALKLSLVARQEDGEVDRTGTQHKKQHAKCEAEFSKVIADGSSSRCFVTLLDHFHHRSLGRYVLVYELLHMDLNRVRYHNRGGRVLPLSDVKLLGHQLLRGLAVMAIKGIIHTDIRPENIMYWKEGQTVIKIIDLGMALMDQDVKRQYNDGLVLRIQNIEYRAPEVLLQLPFNSRVDVWSAAVTLLELATSTGIFAEAHAKYEAGEKKAEETAAPSVPIPREQQDDGEGDTQELDLMHLMVNHLGMPPGSLLKRCTNRVLHKYNFCRKPDGQYFIPQGCRRKTPKLKNALGLPGLMQETIGTDAQKEQFLDLLHQMLRYDPHDRISAEDALKHPFLDTDHGGAFSHPLRRAGRERTMYR